MLPINTFDRHRPGGVAIDHREAPLPAPLQLVLEQCAERRRPTAKWNDALRNASRLRSNGHERRARRLRNDHERVAALEVAERPKLVTDHEHEARADPALRQLLERPPRRIGLVRQSDLDVLRVRRDLRVREPGIPCSFQGDCRRSRERPDASTSQTPFDSRQQVGEPSLGRIGPCRLRDQVDLPPVQATRDNPGHESTGTQPIDRQLGRTVQLGLLLRGCLAAVDEVDAGAVDFEHFRTAIEAKVELTRAGRPRRQLTIHIADVGPADDDDVDGRCGEILDQRPHACGVREAVGDGSAVPVEDDGLETPVEERMPARARWGLDAFAQRRLAGRTCVAAAA